MAYGIPVLSHDDFDRQPPEVEAIRVGETGDLFHAGDDEDMKQKIRAWITTYTND